MPAEARKMWTVGSLCRRFLESYCLCVRVCVSVCASVELHDEVTLSPDSLSPPHRSEPRFEGTCKKGTGSVTAYMCPLH